MNDVSIEVWSCEDFVSIGIIGLLMGWKELFLFVGWIFRRWLLNEYLWKNISFLGFIICFIFIINKYYCCCC